MKVLKFVCKVILGILCIPLLIIRWALYLLHYIFIVGNMFLNWVYSDGEDSLW